MYKKIVISLLVLGVVGTVAYFMSNNAYAQNNAPQSSLIQRLIERFNLEQTEVDKVIQEFRNEKRTDILQRLEDKLDQDVKRGKITNEQKIKIIDKHKEMMSKHPQWNENLNFEERRRQMEQRISSVKAE